MLKIFKLHFESLQMGRVGGEFLWHREQMSRWAKAQSTRNTVCSGKGGRLGSLEPCYVDLCPMHLPH